MRFIKYLYIIPSLVFKFAKKAKNYESIVINYETGKAYNEAYYELEGWLKNKYDEEDTWGNEILGKLNLAKNIVVCENDYTLVGAYLFFAEKIKIFVKLKCSEEGESLIEENDLYLRFFSGYNGIVTQEFQEEYEIVILEFDITFFEE